MPVLFQSGNGPVASIVNAYSAGGTNSGAVIAAGVASNTALVTAAGAYTANTLQSVISHTGRGRVNLLTVYSRDATARTLRCKVTIDGVSVFDATSSSISTLSHGVVVVGALVGVGTPFLGYQPIDYQESLVIEVASSLSEAAANVGIGVNRETWAS